MKDHLQPLTFEIELQPGEKLTLPPALIDSVHAGRWRVTVEPVDAVPPRGHGAFLNGYAAADEGLYDDYPGSTNHYSRGWSAGAAGSAGIAFR